ncbi:Crp/Fnr family transcriptional regulator [Aerococcus kribbianus]|uniref:Crp/Fnr family transcriptional regulator n=1 Tax=Aerococcus kribbianus TaxID=2999064 RepID=A0A9X3FW84_9LACT|nr:MULTISPECIES: Crp/Fnr family transcriptional regulator [unclassified Aerococcus]MCZ0718112.1 Crp/Fnr family transcriptional regulator [Aerococcus sp. YH-aer221]MCZ0726319.1 Crp/Fnr family transcriptional regulator [Aerococcus sp. YH-aer222]
MVNRDLEFYMEYMQNEEFFIHFSPEELNEIENNAVIHQYRKGQILFFQSDPKIFVYYLLKGLVKLERSDSSGDLLYVDYVSSHSFFPYTSLYNDEGYMYNCYAATDIDILLIPIKLMEKLIRNNPDQMLYMFKKTAQTVTFLEKRIQVTAISSAKERVEHMLGLWKYDMARPVAEGEIIQYPLTINELAIVSGTTRETAGKVVRDLTQEGKLKFTRKAIYYYNLDFFNMMIE